MPAENFNDIFNSIVKERRGCLCNNEEDEVDIVGIYNLKRMSFYLPALESPGFKFKK